jgi:TPR repeat protein
MPATRKSWDTFEAMRAAAQEGDAQAQCYLGVCYQNGQGVEQNHKEAVKWFRRSAEQNDPVAQCYLGVSYISGAGVPQEFGEAARWLREAAEQGDPAAQFNLGMLYETGQGVPQNYADAINWYREAAQRGYPAAQFNLGVFYETGQVVPQNFREAAKWYLAAAEQELAPAQCNLGLCYQTGRGVEQSNSEAVKWFIKAARQGDKTAQHNLGLHYQNMEAEEVFLNGMSGHITCMGNFSNSLIRPLGQIRQLLFKISIGSALILLPVLLHDFVICRSAEAILIRPFWPDLFIEWAILTVLFSVLVSEFVSLKLPASRPWPHLILSTIIFVGVFTFCCGFI